MCARKYTRRKRVKSSKSLLCFKKLLHASVNFVYSLELNIKLGACVCFTNIEHFHLLEIVQCGTSMNLQ